jgi:hypothetical protein
MADTLSDDAVKLIKEQCEACLKDEKAILVEMNSYKWIIRGLFIVVLGGSIFGIFKVQDYVDERVASRIEKQDDLYSGAVLAATGESRAALEKLDNFANGVSGKVAQNNQINVATDAAWNLDKVSKEEQSFFFLSLLSTLASMKDQFNDEFIGKYHWKALLNDKYFRQQFLTSGRWDANARFNTDMAFGYLKFGDLKSDIETAKQYLLRAYDQGKGDKKYTDYHVGLIEFVLDDNEKATADLQSAISWPPGTSYRYSEPVEFLVPANWDTFGRLWKKFHKQDFGAELKKLFIRIEDDYYNATAEKKLVAAIGNADENLQEVKESFRKICSRCLADE